MAKEQIKTKGRVFTGEGESKKQVMQADGKPQMREVTIELDLGNDLQDMVKKLGEDVVFRQAKAQLIIAAQALVRTKIESGVSEADIVKAMSEWKPGAQAPRKSAVDKAREQLDKLSPEQRKALLAAVAGGGGAAAARPATQPGSKAN